MGLGAQRLLRSRVRLSVSTTTVASVLGMCLGFFVAGWFVPGLNLWSPIALLIAFATDVVVLGLVSALVLRLAPPPARPSIRAQAAAGESDRLELKSSARVNLRTGQRDERMELIVAKTVAAFGNSDGGTLLLGVDDEGTLLGLAPDFATLKQPDPDRFELWLRDLLQSRLGTNAAGLPIADFEELDDGSHVCRLLCPPSPRPIYLRPGKGQAVVPELWVRVGNSSRMLGVDDAVEYIAHRWPIPVVAAARAQARDQARRFRAGPPPTR
nr:ATP-binding protein [Kineosphaera limosa]